VYKEKIHNLRTKIRNFLEMAELKVISRRCRCRYRGVRTLQVDASLGKSMTFGEFCTAVETAAQHLLHLGCRRGDVIAVFSPNSFQWLIIAAAGLRIGAAFAAVNHLLKPGTIKLVPSFMSVHNHSGLYRSGL